jgi:soluble lytic murein transglycosylase
LERPDALAEARAAWKRGDAHDAANKGLATGSPVGAFLAALAFARLGNDAQALRALEQIGRHHPLALAADEMRAAALRRQGRFREARAAAKRLSAGGMPSAAYVLADIEQAESGCGATKAWYAALKAQPQHEGRHAARRALVLCHPPEPTRISLALDMLADPEPLEDELALEVLERWAEAPTAEVPADHAMSSAERLLFEDRHAAAARIVARLKAPAVPEARARWALLKGRVLAHQGDKAGQLAVLKDALAQGAGSMTSTLERSVLDHEVANVPPARAAAQYLEYANRHPGEPLGVEARHLAGYHFSEAKDLAEAIAQWQQVAAVSGPRQRDAAWFALQKQAEQGQSLSAARQALDLAAGERDSAWAAQLTYWAARWLGQIGQDGEAARTYQDACVRWPARLHARFACARAGVTPAPLGAAEPVAAVNGVERLHTLLGMGVPPRAREAVSRAALLAEAGADGLARRALDPVSRILSHSSGEVALVFAEALLALDDLHGAVTVAEQHRDLVDGLEHRRWVEVAYPRPAVLVQVAMQEVVDEDLVLAIARTESWFSSSVRSRAGAVGLMQVMPRTARKLLERLGKPSLESLWDPESNARCGSWYLKLLQADFGPRVDLLACGYNAGPNATHRFLERGRGLPLDAFLEAIHFRETRAYAKRVLEAHTLYRLLSGKDATLAPAAPAEVQAGRQLDF